jgi:hypothetical protein
MTFRATGSIPQFPCYAYTFLPPVVSGLLFLIFPRAPLITRPPPYCEPNSTTALALELEPALLRNLSLYMLVLLQNGENLARIGVARSAWHNDFKLLFPSSQFAVGASYLPDGKVIPDISFMSPGRWEVPGHHRLLLVFHDHLEHFVRNTSL